MSDTTLNAVVAEARSAIGDRHKRRRFIRTVPVYGYAFSGEVAEATPASRAQAYILLAGRRHALTEGDNLLGRGPDAGVSVDDETVSRRHAMVRVDPEGAASLEDLGSKNGTFLRGRLLKGRATLEDGDEFLIGQVPMRYRGSTGSASTRTARRGPPTGR